MTYRLDQRSHLEVHITRGNLTESLHLVDAVIVDGQGAIVRSFGNADAVVYPRSAIKPLQALSLVESGAPAKMGLKPQHIALASSSHWGAHRHTDLAQQWLTQMNLTQNDLVCGAHMPADEKTKIELIKGGQAPCRLHNNCSGKHTGLLATLQHLGQSPKRYDRWDHFIQVRLRQVMSDLCGVNFDQAPWGVDGCGIPTYAVPLSAIAKGFSALLNRRAFSQERKQALDLVRQAILQEPQMLAGDGAFCTEIIKGSNGKAIVKTGAEGVYCGVSLKEGYAFALKTRDGATRASEVAAASLLHHLGALTADEFENLARFTNPDVTNWEGEVVGKRFVPQGQFA